MGIRVMKYTIMNAIMTFIAKMKAMVTQENDSEKWVDWYKPKEAPHLSRQLQNVIMHMEGISGFFFAHEREAGGYIVHRSTRREENRLPLPPTHLREWYGVRPDGSFDDDVFLQGGKQQVDFMKKALADDNFVLGPGQRILEFGCATGRMLRWFEEYASESEYWGVDITAEMITWSQQNMSPPFHFALTTTFPHLPFPDGYFDLVFAGSVFTHIGELADSWLLELRRILNDGGRIYITVLDDHGLEFLRTSKWATHPDYTTAQEFHQQTGVLCTNYAMFVYHSSPKMTRVIYSREYLVEKLGYWFTVKAVLNMAYAWQTGILLALPQDYKR